MINNILMVASVLVGAIVLFVLYQRGKMKTAEDIEEDFSTIEKVVEAVKLEMVEIVKEDNSLGLSDAEFNALYKRKARINDALKNCVYGIDSAKIIVIELIRGFIDQEVAKEKVKELIGVADGMQPSDHVMFEILLYRFKKKHGKKALSEIMDKYGLAKERPAYAAESDKDVAYYFTQEDLHYIYNQENIVLTEEEQVDVLAVLVYQQYKGFGILDTLREMDINGFNCGTSGTILSNTAKHSEGGLKATNSVWVYYQGKYIHFRFMNFGSEDELRRIVTLLVRYNNPGPLTAKRGYLVNTMYDKSRILALRPPASEYWAVFVRKFTLSDVSPRALIIKEYTQRGDLPILLIEFLMRGMVTCAVTGRQGSGKTTMMSSIIRYIDPRYTLRILEMAPELYLRELYPSRNILSVQETPTVTPNELQDALKKSDAAVSIVGEVATDAIAARMIQMGQVASLFTIFSHHANTAKDLVEALRNSLVNAGGFNNMMTAEKQVTDVVKVDIHLDYSPDGQRYVERITEIIPLSEKQPYPTYDREDGEHSMNTITQEYYRRQTDRETFITRDILRYDTNTRSYEVVNRFSPELEHLMRANLGELVEGYDKFMLSNWGARKEGIEEDEVVQALLTVYKAEENEKMEIERLRKLAEAEAPQLQEVEIEEVDDEADKMTEEDLEDAVIMFDFFGGGGR